MRFSILIPSKNGENYIENCLKSILDQNYIDYEIVIGDNANNLSFKNIINKYLDSNKIKIVTHNKDIPVADNWQSCLNISKGDYIIMLGDDDCLLPNSLFIIDSLIKKNNFPEAISANGIGYYNRGSIEKINNNAFSELYFDYKKNKITEGNLSKDKRLEIVKKMFKFENLLPLNMQPHIISRKAISRIKKNIYQPPFPDHYALNSLLLTAETWIVSYNKVVALGVTTKSFGHFYFNSKFKDGITYLGHKMDFKDSIEGSVLNTCMMIWLMNIQKDYSQYLNKTIVSRTSYLHRQFFFILSQFLKKNINFLTILKFLYNLQTKDKIKILLIIFKFNLMLNGLKKILTKDYQHLKIVSNDLNIYTFTRSREF